MKESESDKSWILKALIGLYLFNVIIHISCIGLGLYYLIFEPLEDLGLAIIYVIVIIPVSIFSSILIIVFNDMKKLDGVKYENYMFLLTISIILTSFISEVCRINIFQVVVIILSLLGMTISIRAIRKLIVHLKINRISQ